MYTYAVFLKEKIWNGVKTGTYKECLEYVNRENMENKNYMIVKVYMSENGSYITDTDIVKE